MVMGAGMGPFRGGAHVITSGGPFLGSLHDAQYAWSIVEAAYVASADYAGARARAVG